MCGKIELSSEQECKNNKNVCMERGNLHDFLLDYPEGFPCGVLCCTFENHPKVIFANKWMHELLGISEKSGEWNEFVKNDLFFMIPPEERKLFNSFLCQAAEQEKPVCMEHRVRNGAGEDKRLVGWVRLVGKQEKQLLFLYMQMPEPDQRNFKKKENAYLRMLSFSYDVVLKIDRQTGIADCLRVRDNLNEQFHFMQGIRIVLDSVVQENFYSSVYQEDQKKIRNFFREIMDRNGFSGETENKIECRTVDNGSLKEFLLVASELDDVQILLCCREITDEKSANRRKEEIRQVHSINAKMEKCGENQIFRIQDYRLLNGMVFLQSSTDSRLQISGETVDTFLKKELISQEELRFAMETGDTALKNPDIRTHGRRHLYVMQKKSDSGADQETLLLLYTFRREKYDETPKSRIKIRTFGYFDILVDGKPVVFHNEKSKEMLAILVDRKGGFVANPYFISCLWEDELYSEKIQSRCRQTAFRMMETLKQYGIEDIIEKVDGRRRIIPEKVDCDYFNYMKNGNAPGCVFAGSYMSDYSWGEETLSTLLRNAEYLSEQSGN